MFHKADKGKPMSILFRFVGAIIVAVSMQAAGAADLVFHQNFEVCWSPAYTKPQFLDAMRTSIEGTSGCLAPQSGSDSGITYTICGNVNGCGTGIAGCPVMMHSGSFTGDFVAGDFSGPGSIDPIAVPITYSLDAFPIPGSCTLTLSAIVTQYQLDYLMRSDGSNGVYSDDLAAPVAGIVSYTRSGCTSIASLIDPYVAMAMANAGAAAGAAIEPALRGNTVEKAICPLNP